MSFVKTKKKKKGKRKKKIGHQAHKKHLKIQQNSIPVITHFPVKN